MRTLVTALLGCIAFAPQAHAQADPYQITKEERAVCTPDATRLCSGAYPDERKLVTCMTANRASLSPACAAVFKAGKRERGLKQASSGASRPTASTRCSPAGLDRTR